MYGELSLLKKAKVRRLVKAGFSEKFSRAAIRMLFDSKAKYVIVPYTDWIDCGKEGRINTVERRHRGVGFVTIAYFIVCREKGHEKQHIKS